mmetsp:Transcript_65627/g.171954  ORF Transcript_65627/g.171954 Transcript_65627/m.171954 type:complete len:297 (+) Transcript_65627:139-1029(+)
MAMVLSQDTTLVAKDQTTVVTYSRRPCSMVTSSPLSSAASTSSTEAEDGGAGGSCGSPHGQPSEPSEPPPPAGAAALQVSEEDLCKEPVVSQVPTPPGRVASKGDRVREGHIQQVLWKTTSCSFFAKGICKKGESCSFAHGGVDVRVRPDLTKTVMCSSWQRRRMCKAGDNCRFAHGPTDLRHCRGDAQRTSHAQENAVHGDALGRREQPAGLRMHLAGGMLPPGVVLSSEALLMLDGGRQVAAPSHYLPQMLHINMQEANKLHAAMLAGDMRHREASKQTLRKMLELAVPDHYED